MSLSTFISKQARKPAGWFGRIVMTAIFDRGNVFLNGFAQEMIAVRPDDRVLEIGCGPGNLIYELAPGIDSGIIVGIDFSSAMMAIARKRNQNNMDHGKVKLVQRNFDDMPVEKESYSKICSVNTLYFWPSPIKTAAKIADFLQPNGTLILAFEDSEQIKRRKMDRDIFHLYTKEEVVDLLTQAGFSDDTRIVSRVRGKDVFHCAVAPKA